MSRDFGVPAVSQGEYCFVSYNAEDYERVGLIVKELHLAGVPLWYDTGIDYGQNYHKVIAEKIDQCSCVLLFFTKKILQKGEESYVFTEYELAKLSDKPIYVVMLDNIQFDDVPYALRSWYIALSKLQNIQAFEYTLEITVKKILNAMSFKQDIEDCVPRDEVELKSEDADPLLTEAVEEERVDGDGMMDKNENDCLTCSEKQNENLDMTPTIEKVDPYLEDSNTGITGALPKRGKSKKRTALIIIVAGILLIAGLIFLLSRGTVSAKKCGDNITWTLDENGVLMLSGSGAMYDYNENDHKVPWYNNKKDVKKIIVENGVTIIGNHAFDGCTQATDVTLPESLTVIGDSAFWDCENIGEFSLPKNLKIIGDYAFCGCDSIRSVVIPDSVLEIGSHVFYYNKRLREIKLSESLIIIPSSSFSNCDALESLTIPASVQVIEYGAFDHDGALQYVKFTGKAPVLDDEEEYFKETVTTIYYPANDGSWENVVNKNYGGQLTWVPY